jgi:hypothetical protein
MPLEIIIKGKNCYGKTRSEQEENLRKDGMKAMTDGELSKLKWAEKKLRLKSGYIATHPVDGDE